MERAHSFSRRFLLPALPVLAAAVAGHLGYFGSRRLGRTAMHEVIAALSGSVYFASVALGPFYVYTVAAVRGAVLRERILAASITPLAWMTFEVVRLLESHPLLECLYWYLNPLNIWLAAFMAFEMGVGTLVARGLLRRRGEHKGKIITPAPVLVIVASLGFVVAAYSWGRGENFYVLFLAGYRLLFGTGLTPGG